MALFKKKPKKGEAEAAPDDEAADATAAPAAEGEEGEAPPAKKKGLPLKLIIIAAAGVLVLGGAGTGAFLVFGPHGPPAKAGAKKDKKKPDEKKDDKKKDKK